MKINRANPPLIKGDVNIHLPKIKKFTLDSGLRVIFVEKKNLPIVQLNLAVNAGSKFDPIEKKGLAYLTSLLIDEGAGNYTALELDNEIESLGSIFGISTDHDLIYLSMLSLEEKFERSLELLGTIVTSPSFTIDDFQREKKKLLTKIISNNDDPSYIASTNFDRLVYKNSHYENPILGSNKTVESLSNDEVNNFYQNSFSAENSFLVVVGNIDQNKLEKSLRKHLGNWTNTKREFQVNNIAERSASNFYFIHKAGAAQSELRIGHLSEGRNEGDYFARLIMNGILGGQFSSRLNLNLRENKGYTYGISSSFIYNKLKGHFVISTSVKSENTGNVVEEIIREIKRIKKEIKQEEIEFVKSYLIKRFPSMFETYSQVARNLTTLTHYSLDDNYFNNYIKNVELCSDENIVSAAQQCINEKELNYLIVGDREKVLPQLQLITKHNIIELNIDGNKIN